MVWSGEANMFMSKLGSFFESYLIRAFKQEKNPGRIHGQ